MDIKPSEHSSRHCTWELCITFALVSHSMQPCNQLVTNCVSKAEPCEGRSGAPCSVVNQNQWSKFENGRVVITSSPFRVPNSAESCLRYQIGSAVCASPAHTHTRTYIYIFKGLRPTAGQGPNQREGGRGGGYGQAVTPAWLGTFLVSVGNLRLSGCQGLAQDRGGFRFGG